MLRRKNTRILPARTRRRDLVGEGGTILRFSVSLFIIRPHHSTTYIDAAYCYRPSSVVYLSVCHASEPCRNGCTNRDAVWVVDLGGPREPCI